MSVLHFFLVNSTLIYILFSLVTVEIENGNLTMVLATDIQYIGYKGLRQVCLYSVQIYGGLFTNIADILVES